MNKNGLLIMAVLVMTAVTTKAEDAIQKEEQNFEGVSLPTEMIFYLKCLDRVGNARVKVKRTDSTSRPTAISVNAKGEGGNLAVKGKGEIDVRNQTNEQILNKLEEELSPDALSACERFSPLILNKKTTTRKATLDKNRKNKNPKIDSIDTEIAFRLSTWKTDLDSARRGETSIIKSNLLSNIFYLPKMRESRNSYFTNYGNKSILELCHDQVNSLPAKEKQEVEVACKIFEKTADEGNRKFDVHRMYTMKLEDISGIEDTLENRFFDLIRIRKKWVTRYPG